MELDLISKRSARALTRETLREFIKSNKDKIEKMLAREAKGVAKLEKNEKKLQKDEGVLPDLSKEGMDTAAPSAPLALAEPPAPQASKCDGCGGSDLEVIGEHQGEKHFMCRTCGDMGATIKQENEQQSVNQAQVGAEALANTIVKADPMAPKPQSVENVRLGAGMTGAPKAPTVKAPEVPVTGATKPQKDAFNTGGMNATTAAAMGKSEASNAADDRNSLSNLASKAKVRSSESRSNNIKTTGNALRGELNPDSFSPGASQTHGKAAYKAELDPSKKTPFNTGAGTSGKPSEEIPDQDVAKAKARTGTVAPPEAGGKVIPAPGSGGQIKKGKLAKDEMPASTPSCIKSLRQRAAKRHADARPIQVAKVEGIPAAPKAPGAAPKTSSVKPPV